MVGRRLDELAKQQAFNSGRTSRKQIDGEPPGALEKLTCWFLRLWFLGELNAEWLDSVCLEMAKPECSHTGFQLVRLLYERGVNEPSSRHRQIALAICPSLTYCGPPLEPTIWWDMTGLAEYGSFDFQNILFLKLIEIARNTTQENILCLFPQTTDSQLRSKNVLICPEISVLLAKLYLVALNEPCPWKDLSTIVQLDTSLFNLVRVFPPESETREYKATLRWDSKTQQKNPFQIYACMKTICGFLNGIGGKLIIGIDDTCQVIGLEGDFSLFKNELPFDEFIQLIHEYIKKQIQPMPVGLVSAHIQPYGSHQIAIINVKASRQHHFLKSKCDAPTFYIRDGNRTIKLENDDLETFFNRRQNS
jgi:hypothetical protein